MVVASSPVIFIGSLIMALVSFLSYSKLSETFQERKVHSVRHFSFFFLFYGIFQLFLGSRILMSARPEMYLWTTLVGHVFLYISIAYFSRIGIYILKPEWEKKVFWLNMLIGGLAIGIMSYLGRIIVPLTAIPSLLNWIGLGTGVFFWMAWKSEGLDRNKMLWLGTGIFLIAVSGPLHNAVSGTVGLSVVESLTVIGTGFIVLGVYYKNMFGQE